VGVAHVRAHAVRRAARALLAAFVLLAHAVSARAHDRTFSDATIAIAARGADVRLTVHRDDAAAALGLASPRAIGSAADAARYAPALARLLAPRFTLTADGRVAPVAWTAWRWRADRRAIELDGRAVWSHEPGSLGVEARLFPDNPLHETFVNVYARGALLREGVLTAPAPSLTLFTDGPAGLWAVLRTFTATGIHHIFTGPDHILFVIALLLLGGGLGRVLKITTAFTIAHSMTLALAVLGVVRPPSRLVEPLIALSIVWVAVQNLRHGRRGGGDARAPVAFGFGLVHGFGFAGALTELGLPKAALGASLFAFNAGVEIGQACIVLATLPLLAWLHANRPRTAPRVVTAASWGVALAGGFWFVQRIVAG